MDNTDLIIINVNDVHLVNENIIEPINVKVEINDIDVQSNINSIYFIKIKLIILLLILYLPFIICDIYVILISENCLKNSMKNISIYNFLLTRSTINLFSLINYILLIKIYNIDNIKIIKIIRLLCNVSSYLSILCNIIGGIIFLNNIHTLICDSLIINYIFTSLIIKYIIEGICCIYGLNIF